jgi:Transposase IS116/IS110/IS902 family
MRVPDVPNVLNPLLDSTPDSTRLATTSISPDCNTPDSAIQTPHRFRSKRQFWA